MSDAEPFNYITQRDADRAAGFAEGIEAAARKLESEGQPGYAVEIRALLPAKKESP